MIDAPVLAQHVSNLGRASRSAAILSLFGFLAVVGSLGYASWQLRDLELQKKAALNDLQDLRSQKEQFLALLARQRDALQDQIAVEKEKLATLETWRERLTNANEQLSATVKATTHAAAVTPEVQAAENARYAIGVYGVGVSQQAYEHLRNVLETEGYTVAQGSLLDSRPSWLSSRSTVLYYDEKSRDKAVAIAAKLSAAAGAEFSVAKGAGLGVSAGQERWSFFIHYVGAGS